MSTLISPTAEQIEKFCDEMKKQLLGALERGSHIKIGVKQKTKQMFSPDYGQTPVDEFYVGAKYIADFQERGF